MKISFVKMTGAGNDFICIDDRKNKLSLSKKQRAALCDRHFGVGGDGLLLLKPASKKGVDFQMKYYNSDGGEADMCGNGARCFANFAKSVANLKQSKLSFSTPAGVIQAEYVKDLVRITLPPPQSLKLDIPLKLGIGKLTANFVNTGVPHAVVFVKDMEKIDVERLGGEVRYHEAFEPDGANVNFVELLGKNTIRVRTYERGVEGETMACGTGMTACAILACVCHDFTSPVKVKVQGGDTLEVAFKRDGENFSDVTLLGPATVCFHGEVEL